MLFGTYFDEGDEVLGKIQEAKGKIQETIQTIRENEKNPEKMALKEYVAFGLGKMGYGSIAKLATDYLNVYYIASGFSAMKAGVLASATKIFDSINDPIVSTVIDNGKGEKGRFKPFLAPLVPVLAALSIVMFIKPPLDSLNSLMIWFFVTYAIWETINTFSGLSFAAIGTVMSADTQERTLYSTIGNIGSQLAGTVPGLIPLLYGPITNKQTGLGLADYKFYTICAVAFAVIGLGTAIFTKDLKERVTPPKKQEHFWENFVTFFKNKYLILLWSTNLSSVVGSAGSAANQEFYRHSLGDLKWQALQWTLAGPPHTLAIFLAPLMLKRFRPSRLIIFTNLLNAGCLITMFLVVRQVGYNTPLGIFLIMLFTVVAWIPAGISDVAREICQMNTFDYTEMQTGQRAEATSLMVTGMLSKWCIALATLVGGFTMDFFGFKEPGKDGIPKPQLPRTKDGLFFIFAIFPAIGALLAAIPIFFFKLEGPEFDRQIHEFRERRVEAEKMAATVAAESL